MIRSPVLGLERRAPFLEICIKAGDNGKANGNYYILR